MRQGARARSVVLALCGVLFVGLAAEESQGQSATYRYDALGRLINVTRTNGTSAAYSYDAAGNRTLVVMASQGSSPAPFELGAPVTNATAGTYYTSASPSLTGFSTAVAVSISGGQYRINGGAWTTTSGTVSSGQTVQVRVQAPAAAGASQTATLTVGGVSDTFQVTTAAAAPDTTPNAFSLGGPVAGATAGAWVASSSPAIAGINAPAPVSISGGQYRINGGAWTTTSGTVSSGQTVQVQVQASTTAGASKTATLTIGGVSAAFQVTTAAAAPDTTPDAFSLGGMVFVEPSVWAMSNVVTISGVNAPTPVSIVGGGEYRINGGAWTTANGTISVGQTVQVRLKAGLASGIVRSTTLTIGGVSDTFQVGVFIDPTGPCVPPPMQEVCVLE